MAALSSNRQIITFKSIPHIDEPLCLSAREADATVNWEKDATCERGKEVKEHRNAV